MRRTEIVARLMQCYEAEVGVPLKVRFMQSILLTMENGELKSEFNALALNFCTEATEC